MRWMSRWIWIGLAIVLLHLTSACSLIPASDRQVMTSATPATQTAPASNKPVQPLAPEPSASKSSAPDSAQPPASLVEDLKSVLAAKTGISATDILLKSAEAVDWPDACLGLAKPDEACAQVLTPGYRVILSASLQNYEFHTNRSGTLVRLVGDEAGS